MRMVVPVICSLTAPFALVAHADETARDQVARLLADLAAAVRVGDADTYMKHVWTGNREFVHEQRYFANDLIKRKPLAFEFTFADGLSADGAPPVPDSAPTEPLSASASSAADQSSRWEVPVRMAWQMEEKSKPRTLEFRAVFYRDSAEPARWLYAGEAWQRLEDSGVVVLFDPGLESIAQAALDDFRIIKPKVEADFGLSLARPQQIKLYSTMAHLQASITLSYDDGLSGWNEPGESIKILAPRAPRRPRPTAQSQPPSPSPSPSPDTAASKPSAASETSSAPNDSASVPAPETPPPRPDFKIVLAHEHGHQCTFELGPKSNDMPWWILEGVAELSTESIAPQRRRGVDARVEDWSKRGQLAPWSELTDFETVADRYRGHVYTQGHHMIASLAARFGRTALNQWLREMSAGQSLDDASRAAFHYSFAELDEQWRHALPAPETPAPASAPADGT